MSNRMLAGLALALAAAAPYAAAADWGAAMRRGDLGAPSQITPGLKTVKMTASTQYLDVEHFATVKIENDKGQSFAWTFDSLSDYGFPVSVIAPKDFAAGATKVYIRHPSTHRTD